MNFLPFIRTRVTWQSYLMIAYYSYLLNALGPLTPFLREELHLTYTEASLHFSAYAVGIILTGLFVHRIARRFGVRRVVWGGGLGMALGALLLMAGRQSLVTVPGAFLMGLLGGLLVALLNSTLAEVHQNHRALAFAESALIASLLSMLAPLAIGFFARTALSWRAALALALVSLPLLWLIYGRNPLPEMDTAAATQPEQPRTANKAAPLPFIYWLYWTSLLLSVAIEFCLVFWSADYLEKVIGLARADAALGVSAFLGAMMVGRGLLSGVLRRFSAQRLLWLLLALTAAGFLLFWAAPLLPAGRAVFALAGLMLAGLGVAGFFPILNGDALDTVPGRMVEANGRISLAVGTAILLLPLLLGWLADTLGLHPAFGLEGVLILLVSGIVFWVRKARAGAVRLAAIPDSD